MADTMDEYFKSVGRLPDPRSPQARAKAKAGFLEYRRLTQLAEVEADPEVLRQLTAQRAKVGGKLAENYLRFVIGKARERTSQMELLLELISAGNEGLMIAIPKFNPAFNTQFLTYAGHWVRVKMDEVVHRLGTVHHSVHFRKKAVTAYLRGTGDGDTHADPSMTPIEDVQVPDSVDVERDASPKGKRALYYLHAAGLSRYEKMVLTLSLGLRGTAYTDDEVALILYTFDRTVASEKDLFAVRERGLEKVRRWLRVNPEIEAHTELG